MSQEFLLPDLGEGLTEAEVVSWLVAAGDQVDVDQMVVEVESAKSVVSLPCPFPGVVRTVHAAEGATVHSGDPLITIDTEAVGAEPAGSGGGVPASTAPEPVPGTALREDADEGSGAVLVGYGTRPSKHRAVRPTGRFGRKPAPDAVPAAAAATAASGSPGLGTMTALDPTRNSPVVSPLVRRLAADHGFNARHLPGSGPGDVVMRADVTRYIAESGAARADPATSGATPQADPTTPGDRRIPIAGLRKVVAEQMSRSRREIPEATIWMDVDATELLNAKARLQKSTGERFSVVALIARFVVAGLQKFPVLNSSVDTARGEIVQHGRINLGLAAQTPRGLMVPVVPDAGDETLRGLRDKIAGVVDKAADGKFAPETLSGGTFTLNNYGPLGTDGSTPIINFPEAAMLGVGRIMDRPWVVDGELAVRKVVYLSLVFDHRVCDGADPSGFLTYVAGCIEDPMSFLADV
ncbi:dihydrolipoamide acetyltransferase family protein [Spelaeicoccus albus]|uniref:Dihydrolipoamide acetyltransferase component of pyruvate dehydrogenase complex n=1 Tax=Spelaeicoccus albus TaxID=1280376 RepID=A0A7Z0D2B8_9MICO|nr:dihydrolipoamide acetyltransferase family protein [Spelaeicoccus albus]NYI67538.1 pyruvate dehydrogenase E2 component (dihydrolipoamide acetyltransferase) [Spelaeicoccus albus]